MPVSQSQMPLPSRSMLISTLVSLVTLNSDPMRETLAAHHKTKGKQAWDLQNFYLRLWRRANTVFNEIQEAGTISHCSTTEWHVASRVHRWYKVKCISSLSFWDLCFQLLKISSGILQNPKFQQKEVQLRTGSKQSASLAKGAMNIHSLTFWDLCLQFLKNFLRNTAKP
jgi:hypothetical protein